MGYSKYQDKESLDIFEKYQKSKDKKIVSEQFAGEFGMEDTSMASTEEGWDWFKAFDPTGISSYPDLGMAIYMFAKTGYKTGASVETALAGALVLLAIFCALPNLALGTVAGAPVWVYIKISAKRISKNLQKSLIGLTKGTSDPAVLKQSIDMFNQDILAPIMKYPKLKETVIESLSKTKTALKLEGKPGEELFDAAKRGLESGKIEEAWPALKNMLKEVDALRPETKPFVKPSSQMQAFPRATKPALGKPGIWSRGFAAGQVPARLAQDPLTALTTSSQGEVTGSGLPGALASLATGRTPKTKEQAEANNIKLAQEIENRRRARQQQRQTTQ